MKTTKTRGDHLTDLIAKRLIRFVMIKIKISLKDFEKKGAFDWRERIEI
jgi:hypothetical protein